jgi:hypothetical protein
MSVFTNQSAFSMEHSDSSSLLVSALKRRLQIIADRDWYQRDAASHLAALVTVSDEIVSHSAELTPPVHPQLKHYLERCSYDKALAFLEGKPPQEGHHSHS